MTRETRQREHPAGKLSQRDVARLLCFAGAAVSILLYLPLVLYATNLNDVEISKRNLVSSGLTVSAAVALLLFLVGRVERLAGWVDSLTQVVVVVVFALVLFPNQTGEITGFDDAVPDTHSILPIAKLALLLGLAAALRWRFPEELANVAVTLSALLLLACLALPLLVTSSSD